MNYRGHEQFNIPAIIALRRHFHVCRRCKPHPHLTVCCSCADAILIACAPAGPVLTAGPATTGPMLILLIIFITLSETDAHVHSWH